MIKTGIKDSYGREINYMRISITDRCNLRCRYCMPDGAEWIPMKEILTYEEITEVCQEAVKLGITRFKITGGEPLVRRGCPEVIRMIKNIPGTELVTLTTNGLLLGEQLEALLSAGLDAVNISLDTLDIKKYEWITGFDKLAVVLSFIEMMPIGYGNMSESISNEELKETIRKHYGNLTEDFRVYGNGPAVYYSIEGFQGNVGFISAMHGKFCNLCNRIRMTSTGDLKPCLCYEQRWALKPALRMENPEKRREEIQNILRKSIENKPQMHCFEDTRQVTESHPMGQIGG